MERRLHVHFIKWSIFSVQYVINSLEGEVDGGEIGVPTLSKMGAYPIRAECLPNPNGVPTQFFKSLYPFSEDSLDFPLRVYGLFFESFSNAI